MNQMEANMTQAGSTGLHGVLSCSFQNTFIPTVPRDPVVMPTDRTQHSAFCNEMEELTNGSRGISLLGTMGMRDKQENQE